MKPQSQLKYFKEGYARHMITHRIYCRSCSHYETEVTHWDGVTFSIDILCSQCGNETNYRYASPYDKNGWLV